MLLVVARAVRFRFFSRVVSVLIGCLEGLSLFQFWVQAASTYFGVLIIRIPLFRVLYLIGCKLNFSTCGVLIR